MGKTRLLREATFGLDPALLISLRAEPYGASSAYRVFRDPIRTLLGVKRGSMTDMGQALEKGVARTNETPRGQIVRDEGLLKLIFRRDTKQILGVHMIGVAASELIHIGMMLLHTGATVDHILNAVFNYPTLSECYRIAALDGVNRL